MAERVVKVRLTAQIAEYASAMEEAASKTREVGSESEKLAQKKQAFQALGTGLVVVGGAMTALTLAVAKTGIEYNTLQQTSRAALTTLLGGAEQANAQMDKLDDFARNSPFAKQTFITAQQQMLAFGIETQKVIPYLDAIQEAVAAAGGSNQQIEEIAFIMAQISAASKITGQDLIQFGQRGINAAELIGSQMGKTGAEIKAEITAGTLGADEALDALAAGMKEKFDGASANVKETFAGAMDRVKAAWRDLSSDLMTPLVDPSGGGALVDFLNWTADVMRAFQDLPEPIKLTGGALFALAGFVALVSGSVLLATPKLVAMKVAFMALSTTMRGFAIAGGGAVIALTAVIAVVGAVAAANAAAEQKAQSYADTLEEGTRRITDATREMIATNLTADQSFLWVSQGSLADNAETLGLSLDTVTAAIEGNADAMDEVNAAIQRGIEEGYKPSKDANLELYDAAVLLQGGLEGEIGALDEAAEKARQKEDATRQAEDASRSSAEAYLAEAGAVTDLNSEMAKLIETINAANGVGQDAVTTNARWQSAIEGISEEVQKQRDAYEEANGTLDGFNASLDQNTASGAENASSLASVAASAQTAAAAQFEQDKATMSADDATQKYISTLSNQRQKFIDAATAAGYSKDEVVKLADQVFKLPSEKEIRILAETAEAQNKIDRLVINNNGRRITITADVNYQSAGGITVTPNYQGGVYENGVKHYAAGGYPSEISAGVNGGRRHGDRAWAEADMGVPWETYISGRPQDRARNIGIWQKTGQLLGVGQQGQTAPAQFDVVVSAKGGIDLLQYVDVRVEQRGKQVAGDLRSRRRADG